MFGYDTAVISGGEKLFQAQFGLDDLVHGAVVASALLGCIIGAAFSGFLADRFGRKPVLILSSLLLLMSAIGSMLPLTALQLTIARLIGGAGVGITSMASPMYMSEVSPARFRGRMVSLYQLAITLGIVCSFTVNTLLLNNATAHQGQTSEGFWHWIMIGEVWRSMFGVETIPAVLYMTLLLFIPESPRWLIKQDRPAEARCVMHRVMSDKEVARSIADIQNALALETGSFTELFHPGFRAALVLGVLLALLTQFSGINAVMYFGPRILEDVGFNLGGAMGGAIMIGIINSVFTFVAICTVDRFGRRPLLLTGVIGACASLSACAILFQMQDIPNNLKLVPLLAYCACFSFSYGPVFWVLVGEIFPTRVRGRAVAMATSAVWIGALTVTFLFPAMLERIGASGAFGIFAAITAVGVVFIWKALPETKGKTLEDIERSWLRRPVQK